MPALHLHAHAAPSALRSTQRLPLSGCHAPGGSPSNGRGRPGRRLSAVTTENLTVNFPNWEHTDSAVHGVFTRKKAGPEWALLPCPSSSGARGRRRPGLPRGLALRGRPPDCWPSCSLEVPLAGLGSPLWRLLRDWGGLAGISVWFNNAAAWRDSRWAHQRLTTTPKPSPPPT